MPPKDTRMFPIQSGSEFDMRGEIPCGFVEGAYEAYTIHHGSQSLEELKRRGGFSWYELIMLIRGPEHYRGFHKCTKECWSDKDLNKR